MSGVIIWGASGHAKVVADAIRSSREHELVGFIDDLHPEREGAQFFGGRILGGREALLRARSRGVNNVVFGFGDCAARLRLAAWATTHGLQFPTIIHPAAVVSSSARIGGGTYIAAGAIVAADASLGEHVIVNTAASIDHDCVVADGAHICPGVRLAGGVHVGRTAWVGIGSVVRENLRIGEGAMLGAGSVVVSDIAAWCLAYGAPARIRGHRVVSTVGAQPRAVPDLVGDE
jgi:acetyltransferase EpsM